MTMQVIENDDLEDTGILDSNGNPLYRARERVKTGFVK